jgi:hypothetical protein
MPYLLRPPLSSWKTGEKIKTRRQKSEQKSKSGEAGETCFAPTGNYMIDGLAV